MNYIVALVKVFQEKAWAENFRNGQLYMNPISYFINSEKEQVGDSSEATALCLKYEVGIKDKYFRSIIRIVDETAKYNPAYCMYAIYSLFFASENSSLLQNIFPRHQRGILC